VTTQVQGSIISGSGLKTTQNEGFLAVNLEH